MNRLIIMGRIKKICPVPGCGRRDLLYLSIHLKKVHGLNQNEKKRWLKEALHCMPEETFKPTTLSADKLQTILMTSVCKGDQQSVRQVIMLYISQIMQQENIGFEKALKYAIDHRGPWIQNILQMNYMM